MQELRIAAGSTKVFRKIMKGSSSRSKTLIDLCGLRHGSSRTFAAIHASFQHCDPVSSQCWATTCLSNLDCRDHQLAGLPAKVTVSVMYRMRLHCLDLANFNAMVVQSLPWHWNAKTHNEMQWSTVKCNETQWNAMKHSEMQWNTVKRNETQWNAMKHNVMKHTVRCKEIHVKKFVGCCYISLHKSRPCLSRGLESWSDLRPRLERHLRPWSTHHGLNCLNIFEPSNPPACRRVWL